MDFFEKNLEEIIYENHTSMVDRGIYDCDHSIMYRQVNLGGYGICDLIGISLNESDRKTINITIYELKCKKIGYATLGQALRYAVGLKKTYWKWYDLKGLKVKVDVCLIGSEVDMSNDFESLLADQSLNISAYTYTYKPDGIKFHAIDGLKFWGRNIPKMEKRIIEDFKTLLRRHGQNQNSQTGTLERCEPPGDNTTSSPSLDRAVELF